ncbi:MAG TPA: hypothetical protein ENI61_03520 [Ignavibacteria bacterium]|nr:hypothetical protein [Ignavibacteria bacterium]
MILNTIIYNDRLNNFVLISHNLFQRFPQQSIKRHNTNVFSLDGISQYSLLYFSEMREVIEDTLMSKGITYKIIKWGRCANSVNEPPHFEFQRKDNKI